MRRSLAPLALLLALLVACGPGAKQRALDTTLSTLNLARDTFQAFDTARQNAIVERAETKAEAEANIAAWREKRDKVVQAFVIAYSALALASLEPTVENLATAAMHAKAVYDAVKELRGGP